MNLAPAARARIDWRTKERQALKDGVEKAGDKTELADSMMEWLVNEKKIDDCWYCVLEDV